jgi:hypothetical protein
MPERNETVKEHIADAVIERFVSQHPELRQGAIVTEIPPTIRWAGVIIAGVMTAAVSAGLFWLASTVNTMQVTLARMDERIGNWISTQDAKYTDLEERVDRIEAKLENRNAPK